MGPNIRSMSPTNNLEIAVFLVATPFRLVEMHWLLAGADFVNINYHAGSRLL